MSRLEGRICVVTGASSGIGRQTAVDLAGAGATVCAAARREDRLASLIAELPGQGHSYHVTDVSDREQVRRLADHVKREHGRCDVLINNAGYGAEIPLGQPGDVENVEQVMRTNFFGAVYCTAELLPLLEASTPSSVVNVASVAGRLAVGGTSSYCASKFALVGWSESLYFELRERDICVSLVEPGFVPTEGFSQEDLLADPLMKVIVSSTEAVSGAIRDAIVHRKMQRVVPRWYYMLQVPRLLSPPVFRFVQDKVVKPRVQKREAG